MLASMDSPAVRQLAAAAMMMTPEKHDLEGGTPSDFHHQSLQHRSQVQEHFLLPRFCGILRRAESLGPDHHPSGTPLTPRVILSSCHYWLHAAFVVAP